MRTTAEWRGPYPGCDESWVRLVLHVNDGEAGVAPAAIGDIVADDRMVKAEAAVPGRPVRDFAGRLVHAWQPVSSHELRLGRIGEVNHDHDVVGKAVEQRRRI